MIIEFLEANMPDTKEQHDKLIEMFKNEAESGDHSFIKIASLIREAKDLIDTFDAMIKDEVYNELENHNEKKASYKNYKVEQFKSKKYDYSNVTWSKYTETKKAIEEKTKKLKEHESLLKTLKSSIADPETGEEIYPIPSTEIHSFKFKLTK